jgi:hypothetical protein
MEMSKQVTEIVETVKYTRPVSSKMSVSTAQSHGDGSYTVEWPLRVVVSRRRWGGRIWVG